MAKRVNLRTSWKPILKTADELLSEVLVEEQPYTVPGSVIHRPGNYTYAAGGMISSRSRSAARARHARTSSPESCG